MRTSTRFRALLVAIAALAALGASQAIDGIHGKKPSAKRMVVLYYFHRTIRCDACRSIERAAQSALTSAFRRELKSGRVVWKPTNLDEGNNIELETHYGLEVQSLVLSEVVGGKEKRWKLLDKTWDVYHNPEALKQYVITETRAFMAGRAR